MSALERRLQDLEEHFAHVVVESRDAAARVRAEKALHRGNATADDVELAQPRMLATARDHIIWGASRRRAARLDQVPLINRDGADWGIPTEIYDWCSYYESEAPPPAGKDLLEDALQHPIGSPTRASANLIVLLLGDHDALTVRREVEAHFTSFYPLWNDEHNGTFERFGRWQKDLCWGSTFECHYDILLPQCYDRAQAEQCGCRGKPSRNYPIDEHYTARRDAAIDAIEQELNVRAIHVHTRTPDAIEPLEQFRYRIWNAVVVATERVQHGHATDRTAASGTAETGISAPS